MEFAFNRSCFIGADDSYSQIVEGRSFFMPAKEKVIKIFIALHEITEAAS